jgi:hypothetical protein
MKTKVKAKAKATKVAPKAKKATTISLGIKFGTTLRDEIRSRSLTAFGNYDKGHVGTHTTRCHRVEKNCLAYRLPAQARTANGQGVVVTRTGKGKTMKVVITREVVIGLSPIN